MAELFKASARKYLLVLLPAGHGQQPLTSLLIVINADLQKFFEYLPTDANKSSG